MPNNARYLRWKFHITVPKNRVCNEMWKCYSQYKAAEVRVVKNNGDSYTLYRR